MKVHQLIRFLSLYDKDTPVLFSCSQESGRSYSTCAYAGDLRIESVEIDEEITEELQNLLDEDQLAEVGDSKMMVSIHIDGTVNLEE